MLKKIICAAFVVMSFFAVVNAQAASANPPMKGGVCYGTPQALTCEHIGVVTIKGF